MLTSQVEITHKHQWHLVTDIILSLPDNTGYRDLLVQYACTCGEYRSIHGGMHVDTRPFTLADLEAHCTREPRPLGERRGR